MAPQNRSVATQALKAITSRLANTSTEKLPRVIPHLANTVVDIRELLSAPASQIQADDLVLVHKFKSQLTSLVQDKSLEARWSAIVLIKAAVEVGGWEVLQSSGVWIRALLSILGKPDPSTTKKLCIITLTRIFLLTQDHQSLIRELTTPNLPAFISACLNIVSKRGSAQNAREPLMGSPNFEAMVQALARLLPYHPAAFRPFVAQIKQLLIPILAPTPSTLHQDVKAPLPASKLVASVQQLYALLPQCAPKNGSREEYNKMLGDVVKDIHGTADFAFRAVLEDRGRLSIVHARPNGKDSAIDVVASKIHDGLVLPQWEGVEAGVERMGALIELVQALLHTSGASTLSISLGGILSVSDRILSVYGPSKQNRPDTESHSRINPEIGREEREGLWLALPKIHASAIALVNTLIRRMGYGSSSFLGSVLEQAIWIFKRESHYDNVKIATYQLVIEILGINGPSMLQESVAFISPLIHAACIDVLSLEDLSNKNPNGASTDPKKAGTNGTSHNADSFLRSEKSNIEKPSLRSPSRESAAKFLETLLLQVPTSLIKQADRDKIDQAAILTENKSIMLASVINPPKGRDKVSILPFLARSASSAAEVEVLLRPRLPVLQPRQKVKEAEPVDEIESEAEDRERIDVVTSTNSFASAFSSSSREDAPSADATQTDIDTLGSVMEPSALSSTPSSSILKRAREFQTDDASLSTTEAVDMPVVKRVRFGVEEIAAETLMAVNTVITQTEGVVTSASLSATGTMGISAATFLAVGDSGDDSDGSFEVPEIIVDSDSEEENEEGEEEEDSPAGGV